MIPGPLWVGLPGGESPVPGEHAAAREVIRLPVTGDAGPGRPGEHRD
jgi:hypothetical protein